MKGLNGEVTLDFLSIYISAIRLVNDVTAIHNEELVTGVHGEGKHLLCYD